MLGIDPGSRVTGWGLVRGTANRPVLVRGGVIRLPARQPFPQRLNHLRREIERIAREAGPCTAAVETLFHGANARSALQLAHARGVILSVLAGQEIAVSEYEPATVKNAIAGNGRADKRQVQAMVQRLLGTEIADARPDLFDALAVALCHLQIHRHRSVVAAALSRDRGQRGKQRTDRGKHSRP